MDSTAISGSWIRTWTWRVRTPKIWCGWNDLFHEDVPFAYALQAFDRMDQTPHHLFLVLTKGPERMEEFWTKYFFSVPLSLRRNLAEGWANNVWGGITAESQERFDKRWPILEQVPSLYKLISYEPALGPLRLPDDFLAQESRGIVVCGGETGKGARPMHPDCHGGSGSMPGAWGQLLFQGVGRVDSRRLGKQLSPQFPHQEWESGRGQVRTWLYLPAPAP